MSAHYTGHWPDLFSMPLSIIDQAAKARIAVDDWTFGGGTALMLQIDHRDSHDIDISPKTRSTGSSSPLPQAGGSRLRPDWMRS